MSVSADERASRLLLRVADVPRAIGSVRFRMVFARLEREGRLTSGTTRTPRARCTASLVDGMPAALLHSAMV